MKKENAIKGKKENKNCVTMRQLLLYFFLLCMYILSITIIDRSQKIRPDHKNNNKKHELHRNMYQRVCFFSLSLSLLFSCLSHDTQLTAKEQEKK